MADKLSGMCKTDRETYEKYWDDIAPFIKFGCLKDDKFADKMDEYIIFKNLEGKYLTLKDCEERAKEENHENKIFYVTDEKNRASTSICSKSRARMPLSCRIILIIRSSAAWSRSMRT